MTPSQTAQVTAATRSAAKANGLHEAGAIPAVLMAGEVILAPMTEVRSSSNAKAKRDLVWRPEHPSWRDGFPTWV
jgi:hypothetical protein